MDLEGLAEALVGAHASQAVSRWLADLDGAPGGRVVASHIRAEQNLPLTAEGRQAFGRLAAAALARAGVDAV
jgi:hypothetical protein